MDVKETVENVSPSKSEESKAEVKEKDNKTTILLFIIVLLLLVILFSFYSFANQKNKVTTDRVGNRGNITMDTNAEEEEEVKALEDRHVFFAGLNDSTLSNGDVINLRNLKENEEFIMKYEIYDSDTNELIFSTDFIESDHYIQWNPYEQLKAGTYKLQVKQIPYTIINGEEISLTSGVNEVTITLT